jgi:hypothetical protein
MRDGELNRRQSDTRSPRMNKNILISFELTAEHQRLEGYVKHAVKQTEFFDVSAGLPVKKFSRILAASTHDKWTGFLMTCVYGSTTYSA